MFFKKNEEYLFIMKVQNRDIIRSPKVRLNKVVVLRVLWLIYTYSLTYTYILIYTYIYIHIYLYVLMVYGIINSAIVMAWFMADGNRQKLV